MLYKPLIKKENQLNIVQFTQKIVIKTEKNRKVFLEIISLFRL